MIGSHSSLGGRDESRIYFISSENTLSSSLELQPTASQSLEMMTSSSSKSPARKVPTISSQEAEYDLRGCQLPGAINEGCCYVNEGGPVIIKQEYTGAASIAPEVGVASSDSESRTSVFSDRLPCGLTRFHFSLCFGMVGFVVFWLGLLLRIYLPH